MSQKQNPFISILPEQIINSDVPFHNIVDPEPKVRHDKILDPRPSALSDVMVNHTPNTPRAKYTMPDPADNFPTKAY